MDPHLASSALMFGLILVAVSLSTLSSLALLRARALVRRSEQRAQANQERVEALLESLRESQDLLAAEVRDREPLYPSVLPGPPKPGLNLSTRSQALRMHRRGDPPDRIAAALDLPLQEVDLLLKVHRIVLSNLSPPN